MLNNKVTAEAPTATSTPAGNTAVVVYPNPATGDNVSILPQAYSGTQDVRVDIFTLSFRRVLNETFPRVPWGTAVKIPLADQWATPWPTGFITWS